jgi:hypothetical protein
VVHKPNYRVDVRHLDLECGVVEPLTKFAEHGVGNILAAPAACLVNLSKLGAEERDRNQMDVDLLFIMVGGGVNGYRCKIWLE